MSLIHRMDVCEVNQKLHYVIELLGDLWHYHQAGAHACSCSVCTKKQALSRSIIAKALQEVMVIADCLESNNNGEIDNKHPNVNISTDSPCGTLPAEQYVENAVLKDGVHKTGQQSTDVEINSSCASRHNNRDERKSSSVGSDSLRDSGLNTSLSSQSVSPILGGKCQHRSGDHTQLQVSDSVNEISGCDVGNVIQSPQNTSSVLTFSSSNGSNRLASGNQRLSHIQANRSSHLPTRNMFMVEDDCPDDLHRNIVSTNSRQARTSDFHQGDQARSSFASPGLMFLSFPFLSPPALKDEVEGYCRHSDQFLRNPNIAGSEINASKIKRPFSHQVHVAEIASLASVHSGHSAHVNYPLTNSEKDTRLELKNNNVTNPVLEKSGFRRGSLHRHLSAQEAHLPVKQKTDVLLQDEHLCLPARSNAADGCAVEVGNPSYHCCKESHTEKDLHGRKSESESHGQNILHSSSTEIQSLSCSSCAAPLKQLEQLCVNSSACYKNDNIADSCNNYHQLIPNTDGCSCCKFSVCDNELCESTSHQDSCRFMWRPWQAKEIIMGLINAGSDEERPLPHETTNVLTSVHSDRHFFNTIDATATVSKTARMSESVQDSTHVTIVDNGKKTAQVPDICGSEQQHVLSFPNKRRAGLRCNSLDQTNMRNVSEMAPSFNCLSSGNISLPHNVSLEQHNQNNRKVIVDNNVGDMFTRSEDSLDIANLSIMDKNKSIDAGPDVDTVMKCKEEPTSTDRSLKCLSNIVQSPDNTKSNIYNSSSSSPEGFSNCLELDKENSNMCLQKPDFKSPSRKMNKIDIISTNKSVYRTQIGSSHDILPTITPANAIDSSDLIVQLCTTSTVDVPVSRVIFTQSECNSVTQEVDKPVSRVHSAQSECNSVTQAVETPVSRVHSTQSERTSITHAADKSSELPLAINQNLTAIDDTSKTKNPITTSSKLPQWGAPAVMLEPNINTQHVKKSQQVEKLPKTNHTEKCQPDSNKPVAKYCGVKPDLPDKQSSLSDAGNHMTFMRSANSTKDEVTKTNGSLKATWKETPNVKADRINLNQTLPASKTLEAKNKNVHKIINDSYEANQSFPKVTKSHQSFSAVRGDQTAAAVCSNGVVEDMHQLPSEWPSKPVPRNRRSVFGFSPPDPHSSPEFLKSAINSRGQAEESHQNRKSTPANESGLRDLWSLLDVSDDLGQIPSIQEVLFNCVTSSLCIVDSERNGKILSVNESFQLLIGVHEKVVGQKLFRFIKFRDFISNPLGQSLPQSFVLADGRMTSVTGTLAHCVNANGDALPVSVWTVPFKPQPKLTVCVIGVSVLMQTDIYLSGLGQVLMYSQPFEDVLGLAKEEEKATYRIPDVDFSQGGKPQHVSLKARDGCVVPVMVTLDNDPSVDTEMQRRDSKTDIYSAVLSVSMNMSGLMVAGSDGVIRFCDKDYFRINLGHTHLENKHQVSDFLSEIMKVSPSSSTSSPDSSPMSEGKLNTTGSNMALADISCLHSGNGVRDRNNGANEFFLPQSCFSSQGLIDLDDSVTDESDDDDEDRCGTSVMEEPGGQSCLQLPASTAPYLTSTPCKGGDLPKNGEQKDVLMENGTYVALFLHGNGSYIPVTFKMSHIQTCSDTLFCLWMCIMPGGGNKCADSDNSTDDSQNDDDDDEDSVAASTFDEEELGNHLKHLHLNKPEDTSVGQLLMDQAGFNQSHNATSDADLLDLEVAVNGSFGNKYAVCEALGQGSFGFVRRAKILGSATTVVVKFIKKSNMFEDSWITNESSGKKIPQEVAVLRETYNEHIIKLLDFHENDSFVQMVMEDFGETDLFDFIDQVEIDEPLACYLFRQVLWAVDYLHSKKIVHRDIKDENVIVNRSFHCKLIDFGSATYMLPDGEMFTKFRGTLEYCSPEVHNGAKYRGPELDVWALGVTLYTVLFRENPFTASEVPGNLGDLPHPVTEDALALLLGLLAPDPQKRFTVLRALSSEWLRQIVDLTSYNWCDLFGDAPAQSDSMFEFGIDY